MDCQAPLSMGFSRQKYWSGLPFPSPGDLPDPGIETVSSTLQVDSLLPGYQGIPNQKLKENIFNYEYFKQVIKLFPSYSL